MYLEISRGLPCKICIIFMLIILKCLASIEDVDEWKKIEPNWNFEQQTKCDEYFNMCINNEENLKYILRKKSHNEHNDPKFASYYQTLNLGPSCSCTVDYHLLDLGRNYYPRYIATGTCQKNSCGPMHQCKEKHYTVKVLKEKESTIYSNLQQENQLLPVRLQDYWNSEIIDVVVACECSPKIL